jgi:hypothetical protein
METRKSITDFTTDVIRLREILQDGRCLTPAEEMIIKTSLETLLSDLEDNLKRRSQSRSDSSH